jgi:phosphatidylglycerol:prolipoprotein diacylglycerol transferase
MRPTLLRLGALQVRSYGVMLVLAFAVGTLWAMREARRRGLAPERMLDVGLAALVGGLIGGRALYVILDPYTTWREFPLVWHGGLSFHGALIGGIIAVAIYALLSRTCLTLILDTGAPGVALGYAVGRIGCFLNGCCYGAPTSLPWGVCFLSPTTGRLTPPSHPAQLYASAGSLIVFALLVLLRPRARIGGQLFIAYLGLYGVMRFVVELWRRGYTAELLWGPLTQAQVASIAMMVIGVIGWLVLGRRGERN